MDFANYIPIRGRMFHRNFEIPGPSIRERNDCERIIRNETEMDGLRNISRIPHPNGITTQKTFQNPSYYARVRPLAFGLPASGFCLGTQNDINSQYGIL